MARVDAVLAGDGIVSLMERIWPAFERIDTSSGALGSAVNWTQDFIERHEDNLETVRWAEAQIPDDAQAIVFGLTLTMQHYTPIDTYEIYNLTPEELTDLLGEERPTYVLLDVYNIETQWRGKSPQINFSILKDDYGLQQVARRGAFTLFEVETP